MRINRDRLIETLRTISNITETPGKGVTRFSYSKKDAEARSYIISKAEALGCIVSIDPVQNIRIAHPRSSPEKRKVCTGSHIDTVRNGGWLDGIYGVCSALEVMESLVETGEEYACDYEVVIFAEEEGSNFGSTLTGSKFLSGQYGPADVDRLKNDCGITMRQVLESLENPEGETVYNTTDKSYDDLTWDFNNLKSMLELHIEQGPVLEAKGINLGIVNTVFGMKATRVKLTGAGNHAGATPMTLRRDAMCAAAECIMTIEKIACTDAEHSLVATVGKIHAAPNCSNVIAGEVDFTFEIRDKDRDKICRYNEQMINEIRNIAERRNIDCEITSIANSDPLDMSNRLIESMKSVAESKAQSYMMIDSGAVHDTVMVAKHADAGIIFVPSIDGKSHVPEEDTSEENLISGAQFLLDVVLSELKENS